MGPSRRDQLEVVIGRAGPGWAGSTVGRPKLARFFRAKILTAQPALKIGAVRPNCLFKEKQNSGRPGRAGPNLARFFSGQ